MKSEITPGWNVFKQIFHDHWDEFKQFNPRYDTAYYDELVNKMLACGNPDQIGYLDYRCLDCGQGKHLVAMSCKSALCLKVKSFRPLLTSRSGSEFTKWTSRMSPLQTHHLVV